MTPTPEQIAALTGALAYIRTGAGRPTEPAIVLPNDERDAAAILAALPGWTLVPTAEVERLRAALEIIGGPVDPAARDAIPVSVRNIARRALAGDAP